VNEGRKKGITGMKLSGEGASAKNKGKVLKKNHKQEIHEGEREGLPANSEVSFIKLREKENGGENWKD